MKAMAINGGKGCNILDSCLKFRSPPKRPSTAVGKNLRMPMAMDSRCSKACSKKIHGKPHLRFPSSSTIYVGNGEHQCDGMPFKEDDQDILVILCACWKIGVEPFPVISKIF